jgi:hypothetical protein
MFPLQKKFKKIDITPIVGFTPKIDPRENVEQKREHFSHYSCIINVYGGLSFFWKKLPRFRN